MPCSINYEMYIVFQIKHSTNEYSHVSEFPYVLVLKKSKQIWYCLNKPNKMVSMK